MNKSYSGVTTTVIIATLTPTSSATIDTTIKSNSSTSSGSSDSGIGLGVGLGVGISVLLAIIFLIRQFFCRRIKSEASEPQWAPVGVSVRQVNETLERGSAIAS